MTRTLDPDTGLPLGPMDHVAQARKRGDAAWQFHHVMTADDREAFDAYLVRLGYPLAYQPGTTESRFYRMVGV